MSDAIEMVIAPRPRDIGGFEVRRVLPHAKRRTVGPFIFFDHFGPAEFAAGEGIDVRPHPHVGLATVSYVFEGEIMHRDSLGVVQAVRPGDLNWMTAGRGIVHSERTGDEERAGASKLEGIQAWVALPLEAEDVAPEFHHFPKHSLPLIERGGVTMRLIAGAAFGERAPVKVYSDMFYLDVRAEAGTDVPLPGEMEECAVHVVSGGVSIDGSRVEPGQMAVFAPHARPPVRAETEARMMVLGGAPMDGPRHLWWNYVTSTEERMEKAKDDWRQGRFAGIPGDSEFIPLPEE